MWAVHFVISNLRHIFVSTRARSYPHMISSKYNAIVQYITNGSFPSELTSTPSNFKREADSYNMAPNGQLLRNGKRVVRFSEREAVFAAMHASHAGRDVTWKKIKERFYWRGGQAYVAQKVSECVACAYKNKQLWKAGLPKLKAIPLTPKAFWRVHIDFL